MIIFDLVVLGLYTEVRYQCMGSWFAVRSGIGYTYAAIADTVEQDTREKFKCLVSFSIVNLVDSVSAPYQTRLFLFLMILHPVLQKFLAFARNF